MKSNNKQIEFKGKSGNSHVFVLYYDLLKNEHPRSAGIYVFTKVDTTKSHTVLDIQLLIEEDEIAAAVKRMKDDGALYAFYKECADELKCDAEIDDIKEGEAYRKSIE